ncbi:hypothetical protein A2763_03905 [Candidatus Kaiserbacteria bacterium RIFCSPHIGHO2_01_FULL_54_36]|uniref:Uncharacterized protein n=1 Tax=Candidatus Kaiserbacteria bacterium RIFCSPHIGHO2_01_FULL_54_36 TaxID=1798482 RepID=A0A1F6CKN6_9BACT|nr:MAG: hypothetical protein A2763_03905 [Candidatus Kaiserbacteria bacterium RIFCSPHIGHO2_01_FULL_54_36]OGG75625.1 MAG: hypothetical protein A3A41_00715 [Candidatus Kaiserbacteria bacterium RIFCSPLOWO2_01_FULL_54_22]
MTGTTHLPQTLLVVIVSFLIAWGLAHSAQAQETPAELSATIRAELMSDPRTAGLSEAQIEGLVNLLTQEAQKQGVTSRDIQWRPQQYGNAEDDVPMDYCGATPALLCAFSTAFGLAGTDPTIPFTLGAASMGLIWILAEMIHRRRHPYISAPPTV